MAVLPLYNILLVPHANIYLKIDRYRSMVGGIPRIGEKMTLLLMKDRYARSELTPDSFYPVGVSGTVMEVHGEGWFSVRTKGRVNLIDIAVLPNYRVEVETTRRDDIDDLDPKEAAAKLRGLKKALEDFAASTEWGSTAKPWLSQLSTLEDVAAAISPWTVNTSNEERYRLLEEDSTAVRAELMEKMIYETLEMTRLSQEGSTARQEDYQKMVRESAIKKQMEYLQKELDELHPENVSDIRALELKIQESGMNETARKEADKLLNRLKQEGQNSAETGMLYNYLDFLTGLSWKKEPAQEIDLDLAEAVLEEDHFGLKKVKDRILQQIAVMNLKKQQSGSILLFVGAPGTGKTSIGQSIARALERQYVRVSLGGVRDEADIRGHRRTYIGAMPGRIMDAISKSGVSNPVMVLDEVDKLSMSYNGDPASALLEVLDPEQNHTFTDHYMNVPYDLSDVFFICTANSVETIPEPLLNRMEVISFQGYTPLEKMEIAKKHLLPKAMESVGIRPSQLDISDEALSAVIADYTREGGVRGLKKRMDTLCRAAAVKIVRSGADIVLTVTPDNLREILDTRPMHHLNVRENQKPGIVTGLAWTAAGGDILYIETMFTKGSGKIIITGQLGDVMKESAQIAVSLVKSLFPESAETFAENDLHIHVPDGATPKDGPSAGVTLTTAIASLVTGKPVRSDIAMTGEVSLRGGAGAIGGLPEKLMAAQRAGVKTVFIPEENLDDLQDVAQEVLSQLEVRGVQSVEEILRGCEI